MTRLTTVFLSITLCLSAMAQSDRLKGTKTNVITSAQSSFLCKVERFPSTGNVYITTYTLSYNTADPVAFYDITFYTYLEQDSISVIITKKHPAPYDSRTFSIRYVRGNYFPIFVNGGDIKKQVRKPDCFDATITPSINYDLLFSFDPSKERYAMLNQFQSLEGGDSVYYNIYPVNAGLLAQHKDRVAQYIRDKAEFENGIVKCNDAINNLSVVQDNVFSLIGELKNKKNDMVSSFKAEEAALDYQYFAIGEEDKAEYGEKLDSVFMSRIKDTATTFPFMNADFTGDITLRFNSKGYPEADKCSVVFKFESGDTSWFKNRYLPKAISGRGNVTFPPARISISNSDNINTYRVASAQKITDTRKIAIRPFTPTIYSSPFIYNHFESLYNDTIARLRLVYDTGKDMLEQSRKALTDSLNQFSQELASYAERTIDVPAMYEYKARFRVALIPFTLKAKMKDGKVDLKKGVPGEMSDYLKAKFENAIFDKDKKHYQLEILQGYVNDRLIFEDIRNVE